MQTQHNQYLAERSTAAKTTLNQVQKEWQKGQKRITYRINIPTLKSEYTIQNIMKTGIKYCIGFLLLIFLMTLIVPIEFMIIGMPVSEALAFITKFYSRQNNYIPLIIACLFMFPAALLDMRYRVIWIHINRKKHKIHLGKSPLSEFIPKISFDYHSENYLPEFRLPKKEYEQYYIIRENVQNAIKQETGILFDTEKFLLHNKEHLCSGSLKIFLRR